MGKESTPSHYLELPPFANEDNARGILCGPMVLVTGHYADDLSLDSGALEQNIEYLIEHGIRMGKGCLLIGGAGADFPMLTLTLHFSGSAFI
jgi:hypothetical protein